MILEGLSDISEARQKLWYIEYTSKGITDAKVICNSQSYNKYKKFAQGYKEIQKVEITSESEKSFYTSKIRDDLESRYGVKDYTGDNKFDTYTKDGYTCTIVGKYRTDSYGYMVSDTKLEESYVVEGNQDIWVIKYSGLGLIKAEFVCNSGEYNKIKKNTPGYKEIEAYNITKNRGNDPKEWKVYINDIKYTLNKMGVKSSVGSLGAETKDGNWCFVIGKDNTPFFGYRVIRVKDEDSGREYVDESVKMVEADVDAQYEIYKKTGEYPEETIVKATWELDIADDNHIFLTKNGKKKKFKIIPDNRGIKGYIGKPMKTGVKSVYYGADRFVKFIEKDLKASHNGSNTMVITLFNGIWDICKEAK